MIKNLFLVHQFTLGNNVFFEFHLHYYLVKDLASGTTLFREEIRDDLYHFQPTSTKAFIGEHNKSYGYTRLDHLSLCFIQKIINRFDLPFFC